MNAPQIHPEDLLDRARAGTLSKEEHRVLELHLSRCPACRFERSLVPGLYAHIDLSDEDDALLSRALDRAMAPRWYGRPRLSMGLKLSRRALLAVAAIAVVSIASAAMYGRATRVQRGPDVEVSTVDHTRLSSKATVPRTVVPEQSTVLPSAPEDLPSPTTPPPHASVMPSVPQREAAPSKNACADQFRDANKARRDGKAEDAIRLYETLETICPGSTSEVSSRVLVGRIYLDRLGDPKRALAAFESYIQTDFGGPLREEATIGKALALGKLNRGWEERATWESLLKAYPDSIYAEKARARLNELR